MNYSSRFYLVRMANGLAGGWILGAIVFFLMAFLNSALNTLLFFHTKTKALLSSSMGCENFPGFVLKAITYDLQTH